MNEEEIFFKDKENCKFEFYHIENDKVNPALTYIDELYGAADALSQENYLKHKKNLKYLSIFGAIVVFLFLLYDEAELHLLIFGCILFILFIYCINRFSQKSECHRKYTQYRVLAECLRVQYYISHAGINRNVSELLPWFTKKGIPWIDELVSKIGPFEITEKNLIINCWIRDQRDYHQRKYNELKIDEERNNRIESRVTWITAFTYILAVGFEIWMLSIPSGEIHFDFLDIILNFFQSFGAMVGYSQTDMIRSILKIVLGSLSAITLLTGNYYGKMSLTNIIEDHRRMEMLYETAKNKIMQNGFESEELIIDLAREFLIENSTWYAYQKTNTTDLTFE